MLLYQDQYGDTDQEYGDSFGTAPTVFIGLAVGAVANVVNWKCGGGDKPDEEDENGDGTREVANPVGETE